MCTSQCVHLLVNCTLTLNTTVPIPLVAKSGQTAMLRMDKSLKPKDRLAKVEEVIKEMGLSKCAQTQVGSSGNKRGISGGEMKRLSFACERTSFFLLSTSTSEKHTGLTKTSLDSFMAQNIVQTLQNMASRQRTILCTIHQPSSEIYALFDQLLLMAEGRVAFMGSAKQALEFFNSLNYVCPPNFNPSDFFVLTLAIVPEKEDECRNKVRAICDTFSQTELGGQIMKDVKQIGTLRRQDSLIEDARRNESRYQTSWGRQFFSLLWRSWVSLIRDVILLRVRVIQTLSFPNEVAIFLREYGSGLYRVDVYFLSKILAELPTFVVIPLLFITVDYWMIGLYQTGEAYIIAGAVFVLVANVAVSFGYVISTVSPNVNVGLALAPPLMIPLILFGGFFLNDDSIPVYFIWLKYLSWFKYANELLAVNQWENVDYLSCTGGNSTSMADRCLYGNGTDVLTYLSYSKVRCDGGGGDNDDEDDSVIKDVCSTTSLRDPWLLFVSAHLLKTTLVSFSGRYVTERGSTFRPPRRIPSAGLPPPRHPRPSVKVVSQFVKVKSQFVKVTNPCV
ncbi:hypothetical protein C0Q70_00304 [Pomacea canaliculata]|uniref:ABC-2 type transporter domain-containing protein n=1 Tax=Pomacea canaliculata TaxID=400727 RepID=A0A2T7PWA1_POMCA|nr:hypothetical protein C0Q70_00304 [Pomacea canaliculata]